MGYDPQRHGAQAQQERAQQQQLEEQGAQQQNLEEQAEDMQEEEETAEPESSQPRQQASAQGEQDSDERQRRNVIRLDAYGFPIN